MKTKNLMTFMAALIAAGAFLIVGCSSDSGGSSSKSFTNQVIDDIVEDAFADSQPASTEAEFAGIAEDTESILIGEDNPVFYDMILKDDIVYAGTENGVLTHNLIDGETFLIPAKSPITAMVDVGDKILIGGDNIYNLNGYEISDEDYQLELAGTITALYQEGLKLFIGTSNGLYLLDTNGLRELASGIHVSGIVSDGMGIWVGTGGEGLYRWNGDNFRKRYLKRDSTLFDNVTALDYKHNHLYLGTDQGFFVYDGGRWTPYGIADGLPSEVITAVDAGEWVVKVGTANGPVTFFNNEFKLMSKLEGMVITRFIKNDNKLLAATSNAGLIMKSGGLVTTLFDGDTETTQVALEEAW